MHHFGEKTKINLDFGRFCIIFVLKFEGRRDGVKAGKGQGGGDTMCLRLGHNAVALEIKNAIAYIRKKQ